MKHDVIRGVNRYTADEGKGFIRKDEVGKVSSTELWLGPTDTIENYVELPLGTNYGEPMKYSTLSIKRELAKLGKWDAAKSLLEANGYWDDYVLANYLAETDLVFTIACAAMIANSIVTEEELNELLPKCVWTAE